MRPERSGRIAKPTSASWSLIGEKEMEITNGLEITDGLLAIILVLLVSVLNELRTLRAMAQAWAKTVSNAGERGDIRWLRRTGTSPEAEWR
jgi:hypothetical protein